MENSADQDQRIMKLLAAALKRPATERCAFLQNECRGDLELLREVEEAVDWEERMGNFLREPLVACPSLDRPFRVRRDYRRQI